MDALLCGSRIPCFESVTQYALSSEDGFYKASLWSGPSGGRMIQNDTDRPCAWSSNNLRASASSGHQGLSNWVAFYNNRRPHQVLSYRTPMAVWRNGAVAQAVDMMDNARALPTCPQPQQQQQTDLLAA
jgi:hypothetical protein